MASTHFQQTGACQRPGGMCLLGLTLGWMEAILSGLGSEKHCTHLCNIENHLQCAGLMHKELLLPLQDVFCGAASQSPKQHSVWGAPAGHPHWEYEYLVKNQPLPTPLPALHWQTSPQLAAAAMSKCHTAALGAGHVCWDFGTLNGFHGHLLRSQ